MEKVVSQTDGLASKACQAEGSCGDEARLVSRSSVPANRDICFSIAAQSSHMVVLPPVARGPLTDYKHSYLSPTEVPSLPVITQRTPGNPRRPQGIHEGPQASFFLDQCLRLLLSPLTSIAQIRHTQICHTQICHTQICHPQICRALICHTQMLYRYVIHKYVQRRYATQTNKHNIFC